MHKQDFSCIGFHQKLEKVKKFTYFWLVQLRLYLLDIRVLKFHILKICVQLRSHYLNDIECVELSLKIQKKSIFTQWKIREYGCFAKIGNVNRAKILCSSSCVVLRQMVLALLDKDRYIRLSQRLCTIKGTENKNFNLSETINSTKHNFWQVEILIFCSLFLFLCGALKQNNIYVLYNIMQEMNQRCHHYYRIWN